MRISYVLVAAIIGSVALGLNEYSAAASKGKAAAPEVKPYTDAQIAAIVVAANQVDIKAGKLALSKSNNSEVKDFANLMVTDHTGLNKAAVNLVGKLNIQPQENASSKHLTTVGEKTMQRLKGMNGAKFDKAYINNEVSYHETVLGSLDYTLIPNAQNPELKDLLRKARPTIAAHLDHAKRVQAALGKQHG
jgi:putative membrane protein